MEAACAMSGFSTMTAVRWPITTQKMVIGGLWLNYKEMQFVQKQQNSSTLRPLNDEKQYVVIHIVFTFLECIKIGENLRQHPFSVARPLLSPDQLTHPFTLQQDQLTIQKQPDLHTIKKQPRDRHIMPELLREAEVLEMMMISALVMTTTTMASLENDDVMDVDFIIDIIDKTENKVIFLKKGTILYYFNP